MRPKSGPDRLTKAAEPRPRATVWSQRSLIWNFAQRDLKSRFKGTAFGWTWSLMVPLATVIIYSIVFSVIFRASPPDFGSGRPGNFTVWLMVGLVPWTFFLIAINIAIPTLLSNGPLLQKIYFPAFAPVLGATLGVLVQTIIEFGILAVILLIFGEVGPTWLLFPVWLCLFVLFVNGIATSLAILNVYARDLAHITAVVLQLLFFLTPIIYPITLVPEEWHGIPLRTIVQANPLSVFIESLRGLVYGLQLPSRRSGSRCSSGASSRCRSRRSSISVAGRTSASRYDRDRHPGRSSVQALLAAHRASDLDQGAARARTAAEGSRVLGAPRRLVLGRTRQHLRPGRSQRLGQVDHPEGAGRDLSADERPRRGPWPGLGTARARSRVPRGADRDARTSALNGAILGMSGRQIDSAMDGIIDFAGIGEFIDSPVKVYSSGMFVRLGFAIAVSLDPEILIVDEVIAVGDEEFQRKCFDHLFELRKRGTTIVLVTHALGLIADLCDRAAWLDHGVVQEIGPAREVADSYLSQRQRARGSMHRAETEGQATIAVVPAGSTRLDRRDPGPTVESLDADCEPGADPDDRRAVHLPAPLTPPRRRSTRRSSGSASSTNWGQCGGSQLRTNRCPSGAAGRRICRFRGPELLLQPATYQVSTAIVDRGHTYDYADREFDVAGPRDRRAGAGSDPDAGDLDRTRRARAGTGLSHRGRHAGNEAVVRATRSRPDSRTARSMSSRCPTRSTRPSARSCGRP